MTDEIKMLEKAKLYIEKLSKGINPLTGYRVLSGDIVKNERISRCLAYVSEVFSDVLVAKIEAENSKNISLENSHEIKFEYSAKNLTLSQLSGRINDLYLELGT